MLLKKAVGAQWGPAPYQTRWIFMGMVRPMLSYGSLVWAHHVQNTQKNLTMLKKLQRLALLTMGHFRRSTPTTGMEVIMNLTPLPLFLKQEALTALARIRGRVKPEWDGIGNTTQNGHILQGQKIWDELKIPNWPVDTIPGERDCPRLYKIGKPSQVPTTDQGLHCYTDGSKRQDHSGCAYTLMMDGAIIAENQAYLGITTDVLQTEILAIELAAKEVINHVPPLLPINIVTDSQGAISALEKKVTTSKLVGATKRALNDISLRNPVTIHWVQAHQGNKGNERADLLAKEASSFPMPGPEPLIPVPMSLIKVKIKTAINKCWESAWTASTDCRQTKLFFPSLNPKFADSLFQEPRESFSRSIRWLTGHDFLGKHQLLTGNVEDNTCRLCADEIESAWHIITECSKLEDLRQSITKERTISNPKKEHVSYHGLLKPQESYRIGE